MRRKHLLALGALFAVIALAGCLGGSSEISADRLNENASYEWNTSANATYNISRSSYAAILTVTNESVQVWQRDAIEGETPVRLRALKFRFDNGTVVRSNQTDNLTARTGNDRTTIEMPTDSGQVAYTAPRSGKSFSTPVVVNGSQEILLPPGARVGIPLLSQVGPGNWNSSVENNRMTVRWENQTDGTLNTRYYLERDLLIFAAVAIIAILVGGGGGLYYLREIRTLEAQRDELGIDIDYDDDEFDDDPPPGMK